MSLSGPARQGPVVAASERRLEWLTTSVLPPEPLSAEVVIQERAVVPVLKRRDVVGVVLAVARMMVVFAQRTRKRCSEAGGVAPVGLLALEAASPPSA